MKPSAVLLLILRWRYLIGIPVKTFARTEGTVIMMQFDRQVQNGDKVPGSEGENQLPIG